MHVYSMLKCYYFLISRCTKHVQGSHASVNIWECYEICEKKFQDWKCYGNFAKWPENLQNVLEKPLVSWVFLEMVKGALKRQQNA